MFQIAVMTLTYVMAVMTQIAIMTLIADGTTLTDAMIAGSRHDPDRLDGSQRCSEAREAREACEARDRELCDRITQW